MPFAYAPLGGYQVRAGAAAPSTGSSSGSVGSGLLNTAGNYSYPLTNGLLGALAPGGALATLLAQPATNPNANSASVPAQNLFATPAPYSGPDYSATALQMAGNPHAGPYAAVPAPAAIPGTTSGSPSGSTGSTSGGSSTAATALGAGLGTLEVLSTPAGQSLLQSLLPASTSSLLGGAGSLLDAAGNLTPAAEASLASDVDSGTNAALADDAQDIDADTATALQDTPAAQEAEAESELAAATAPTTAAAAADAADVASAADSAAGSIPELSSLGEGTADLADAADAADAADVADAADATAAQLGSDAVGGVSDAAAGASGATTGLLGTLGTAVLPVAAFALAQGLDSAINGGWENTINQQMSYNDQLAQALNAVSEQDFGVPYSSMPPSSGGAWAPGAGQWDPQEQLTDLIASQDLNSMYTPAQLSALGYTATQGTVNPTQVYSLLQSFDPATLQSEGITPALLSSAGFSPSQISALGLTS